VRAAHAVNSPELCVVVLSYQNEETVLAAVDSVLEQAPDAEVVVSHSGGGPTPALLARERPRVRVVASEARRSCSEARNAGIAATTAAFVSFLEADCLAEPGWIAGRLREHRAGADAVASAITNAYPASRSAWASHLLRYQQRFPEARDAERLMLGLSCRRETFTQFGQFRDDLPGGEDSEFTERLLQRLDIVWAGDVRTAHRNADAPAALLRDHYRRGVRNARTQLQLGGRAHTRRTAWAAVANLPGAVRWARRIEAPEGAIDPLCSWPLLVPATAAYVAGLIAGRRRP
jgi:glycosyltransferase involved in cell wall biosynthesis